MSHNALIYDQDIKHLRQKKTADYQFRFADLNNLKQLQMFQENMRRFYTREISRASNLDLHYYKKLAEYFKSRAMMLEYRHCMKRICELNRPCNVRSTD